MKSLALGGLVHIKGLFKKKENEKDEEITAVTKNTIIHKKVPTLFCEHLPQKGVCVCKYSQQLSREQNISQIYIITGN